MALPQYRSPDRGSDWMCHCGRLVIRKAVHRRFGGGNGSRAAHGAIVDRARYARFQPERTAS